MKEMGYSFLLAAGVLLYTLSHREDSTYHGLCYTSRGTMAGTSCKIEAHFPQILTVLPTLGNNS